MDEWEANVSVLECLLKPLSIFFGERRCFPLRTVLGKELHTIEARIRRRNNGFVVSSRY